MCDRCADYDYPIAACWRPCYVPRAGRIQVNIHDSGEQYFEPVILRPRYAPFPLARRAGQIDSRDSFEGVE